MIPDRSSDRPAFVAFADAIATRPQLIHRDACGDWNLFGSHGHVYAIPEHDARFISMTANLGITFTPQAETTSPSFKLMLQAVASMPQASAPTSIPQASKS